MKSLKKTRRQLQLRRSFLETLESRTNMAAWDGFGDLADEFADRFQPLQQMVGDVWTESAFPLIGQQLANLSGPFDDVRDAVVDAMGQVAETLDALGDEVDPATIDSTLEQLFQQKLAELGITATVDASTTAQDLLVHLDLSRDLSLLDESVGFEIGLGAVPLLGIGAEAAIQVGIGFTGLQLTLGAQGGAFFYEVGDQPVSMSLYADFAGTEFHVSAGLFTGQARIEAREAGADDVLPGAEHALEIALTIDPQGDSPINISAGAHFDLVFTAGVDEALIAGLPYIQCTVGVDWFGLDSTESAAPVVEYRDVQLGFSGVVSRILAPIIDHLGPVLDRVGQVFGVLQKPLPVLEDLVDPDPSVLSLLNIAAKFDGAPPEFMAAVRLLNFATAASDIVSAFDVQDGDLLIPIGNFSLSDNGDLRDEALGAFSFENLGTGVGLPSLNLAGVEYTIDVEGIKSRVGEHYAAIASSVNELLDALQGPVSFSVPLLSDPSGSVFQLLLGQDVDLFRADIDFEGSGGYDPELDVPGLSFGFGSDIAWKIHAGLGLDTRGLRGFFQDAADGQFHTGRHLGEGFYFTEDTSLKLTAKLAAELSANLVIVHAGIEGGIKGEIGLQLTPSDEWLLSAANTGALDDKLYIRSDFGAHFGRLSGAISGFLDAWVGIGVKIPFTDLFVGGKKEFHLAERDLVRFGNIGIPNPFYQGPDELFEPGTTVENQMAMDTAAIANHELWLNVGDRSQFRETGGVDSDDDITVEHVGTFNGFDTLRVTYAGRSKTYAGISRIVANGGEGEDRLVIGEGVTADVLLVGGADADYLVSNSAGYSELWGDEQPGGVMLGVGADDYLQGGLGMNLLVGGEGNDHLIGGAGDNVLIGSAGDDVLVGGAGDDVIHGDNEGDSLALWGGDDVIHAGGGADEVHGGGGDDLVFGAGPDVDPASDRPNVIHGDAGDDSIFAGHQGDTIYGGAGNDFIEAGAGDDVIATYAEANPLEVGSHNFVHWSHGSGAAIVLGSAYAFNHLSLTGSSHDDRFDVNDGASLPVKPYDTQLEITIDGAKLVRATNVHELNIDGEDGRDTTTISPLKFNPLAPHPLARISVNMSTEFRGDGDIDQVFVHGTNSRDRLVVESLEAWLQDVNSCGLPPASRDEGPDLSECRAGGVMRVSGLRAYDVYLTNEQDELVVTTGTGDDDIEVRGVTGPTRIETGAGNDAIVVSARTLGGPAPALDAPPEAADFLDQVLIDAGSGLNTLRVTHEESLLRGQLSVEATRVSSNLIPEVQYLATGGAFGELTVSGGQDFDSIHVLSTSNAVAQTRVTGMSNVHAVLGAAADEVIVSSTGGDSGELNGIHNQLVIEGHLDGETAVRISDRRAMKGNGDVVWAGNQLTGMAGANDEAVIEFGAGQLDVTLLGSDAANVAERYSLNAPSTKATLDAGGGSNDQLRALSAASQWDLFGTNAGKVIAGTAVTFANVEWLVGTAGSDQFGLREQGGVTGGIDGAAGSDTLDYSSATSSVFVDLATGRATRAGVVTGIENVQGGSGDDMLLGDGNANSLVGNGGDDVLVGQEGNDVLIGGAGRDILIGGMGVDELFGLEGDDLLIGGVTKHDLDANALSAIRREWSRQDLGAAQRRANLLQGRGLAGGVALNAKTVAGDGVVDQLFGQAGSDWFWNDAADFLDAGLADLIGG